MQTNSIETLFELAQIVSRNKTKRIEIIGNPNNYNSRSQILYETLTSSQGDEINEEGLAETLFPESNNRKLSFSRLKQRLFKRLVNTLFFIDVEKPTFNELQRAYYTSYRDFAAMKILVGRSGRKSSTLIGEKILRTALKFEFTDLSVDVLRFLCIQYGSILGNQKKHQKATELFRTQKTIMEAEDIASEYYTTLAINFVKSRSANIELKKMAVEYSNELYQLESNCNTQRFLHMAYTVHVIRYQLENDFEKSAIACDTAIQKLKAKGGMVNLTSVQNFFSNKASANIKLGKYKEAQGDIQESLNLATKGTINWYITKYYLVLVYFHTGDYQQTFSLVKKALEHPKFKNLPQAHKEYWTIAEAYVNYLIDLGEIQLSLKEAGTHGQFRIQKFLNEVPVYSKDKRGANISILILQILFLLQKKKYEESISRLDKLKDYSNKHLRKNDTFRSNCFIRMLMQLPNSYYNRKAAIRKADKYLKKLEEVPLEVAAQSSEMEIIPFEKLWEMVLKSLKG